MVELTHCVYRMYDARQRLLYVGLSGRPLDRFSQHRRSKHWFSDVAFIQVAHFDNQLDAQIWEADAILSEGPLHNTPHRNADAILKTLKERRAKAPTAKTIGDLNRLVPDQSELNNREQSE